MSASQQSSPIQPISKITASSSQTSPLLKLSTEIRLMIYNLLFDCKQKITVFQEGFMCGEIEDQHPWEEPARLGWVCHVHILRTCRLIRAEAMKLFFQKCHFVFVTQVSPEWCDLDGSAPKTKNVNTDFIRKISLTAPIGSDRIGGGIFDIAYPRYDVLYLRSLKECAMLFPGLRELTYLYDEVDEPTFATMKRRRVKLCVSPKMALEDPLEVLVTFCEKVDVRIEVRRVVDRHTLRNVVGYSGSWISQSLGRGMELVNFVPLHE
ncbi:MAG: hypothetical protein Q9204_008026 [Flavoplaca sp. TL-2023a]